MAPTPRPRIALPGPDRFRSLVRVTNEYGRRVAVIIDDDADTRSLVETVLIQSGFETMTASNGKDGIDLVKRYQPTVTTLDVGMPGMDGFTAARMIRNVSNTYVVMITAMGDEIDVVEGLGAGADDYLVKPFRARELRARIERVLSRMARETPAPGAPVREAPDRVGAPEPVIAAPVVPVAEPATPGVTAEPAPGAVVDSAGALSHNGLELDEATRMVRVDGAAVELTRSEFDLMAALMHSGRRVRSKADLVLALRGESYVTDYYVTDADKRAIEVHIANLRRKIGDSTGTPRWIETVRGVGYRMT